MYVIKPRKSYMNLVNNDYLIPDQSFPFLSSVTEHIFRFYVLGGEVTLVNERLKHVRKGLKNKTMILIKLFKMYTKLEKTFIL